MVKTLDWSPDSARIATGGHEGVLRVFDVREPDKEPRTFTLSQVGGSFDALKGITRMPT